MPEPTLLELPYSAIETPGTNQEVHRIIRIERRIEFPEISQARFNILGFEVSKVSDTFDRAAFKRELSSYLARGKNHHAGWDYCIDFSGLEFFSAASLATLIDFHKKHYAERKRALAVASASEFEYEFKMQGLHKCFAIYPDVEAYLSASYQCYAGKD